MAKLPIGVQNFSQLIKEGFTYVDKTEPIYSLVTEGTSYFFSRPRRFGKSLLVSTLEALFRGERALFQGTWIDRSEYPWTSFPVLRLDFSMLASDSSEKLTLTLIRCLERLAKRMGVALSSQLDPGDTLAELVEAVAEKKGSVVLLIDEYDYPLTRHIENPELHEANRQVLSNLFATIKGLQSAYLRFLFITGVSRFSKVSLFSGLNNLKDISLRSPYGALVGFTEKEIAETFAESIALVAQTEGRTKEEVIDEMRKWYNGYSFDPLATDGRVFNPWSVMNYLDSGRCKNYWFDSATPTFAIKLIERSNFFIPELETGVEVGDEIEASSDVSQLPLTALLFQTGYLTIDSFNGDQDSYLLRYPNEEVRQSLIKHLFLFFTKKGDAESRKIINEHRKLLEKEDFESFFASVNVLLAEIPYMNHIAQEAYYQSMIYLMLRMLGMAVNAEVSSHRGRADLVVKTKSAIILFEFKFNRSAQEALDQIHKRGYADRYRTMGKVILIGANISSDSRSVNEWEKTLL